MKYAIINQNGVRTIQHQNMDTVNLPEAAEVFEDENKFKNRLDEINSSEASSYG